MTAGTERKIFLRGEHRDFTYEEWVEWTDRMYEADERGDRDEFFRIAKMIPVNPEIAMAFKKVYGKEFLLSTECDLTRAEEKWGKGWLDESQDPR